MKQTTIPIEVQNADVIVLNSVSFTGAHTKAQAKIQAGAPRAVHAYAVGTCYGFHIPQTVESLLSMGYHEVTYKPKERAGFYELRTGAEVEGAQIAIFLSGKMLCAGVRYV